MMLRMRTALYSQLKMENQIILYLYGPSWLCSAVAPNNTGQSTNDISICCYELGATALYI